MNDLYFIFYDAKRMFLDTADMSCAAERAHRRLCDFIWFSDKPPRNSPDVLQQISHTKHSDWAAVFGELLSKGWHKSGDFLIHSGVITSLNDSKEKYVEKYNRSCAMNGKPKLELSNPDIVTGIVTYNVTGIVTSIVDVPQSESESQPTIKTTKLPTSLKKVFTKKQGALTGRFHAALNGEWENDRQKWMGRIKNNTEKSERVVAEVESAIKERRIKTTPARYAEEIWKEFK